MRRVLILLFALFFLVNLSAQLPKYWYWHHLGIEQGLRKSPNNFMFKDSRGFVWIGSADGVQRFDGNPSPIIFGTLPTDSTGIKGQNIQGAIVEDEQGDIWITTYQALNHYDYKSNKFTPYSIEDSIGDAAAGYFSCGQLDQVNWLLYKGEIWQFDFNNKKFHKIYETGKTFDRGIVKRSNGMVYLFAYTFGEEKVSGYIFKENELIEAYDIPIPEDYILSVLPVDSVSVLFGVTDGLLRFNMQTKELSTPSSWKDNNVKEVSSLSLLSQDSILIGNTAGNVFCLDLNTDQIEEIDFSILKENDPDDGITAIYTHLDGTIFISGRMTGVYYCHKNKAKFSTLLRGKVIVGLMQTEEGDLLVFTNNNILLLDEKGKVIKDIPITNYNKNHSNKVYFFKDMKGKIYTSYFWRIQFYDPDIQNFRIAKNIENMNHAIALNDNRILISEYVRPGLMELDKDNNRLIKDVIPGTESIAEVTFSFQNEMGDLLLAEGLMELSIYNTKSFFKKDSVPYSGEITAMYEFPGDSLLWIGSAIGLTTLNYRTRKISPVMGHPSIPGDDVYSILPGVGNDLWLSTNQGLCKIDRITERVTKYTKADGLPSMEFTRHAHLKLRDGRLAFGTMNGLVIFDPNTIASNIPLAKPRITNVLIDGEESTDLKCTKTGATNYDEIKELELSPWENRLEFRFAALEFSHPSTNQLRYRLLPDEEKWSEEPNGGKCRFRNLSPNTYTLEVQATHSDGILNPDSKKLVFTILPHWYQKGWAIFLMFIIFVGVIIGASVYTQKRKQKIIQLGYEKKIALEKQRVLISRNMHDDLGSALSAIKLKTSTLSIKSKDLEHKRELKQLGIRIKSIDQKIQDAIWAVDARNDTVEKLIDYLVNHIRDLFDDGPMIYELLLPKELPEYLVSGDIRRMVALAYKEILNNIIKHANAKKIWVNVYLFNENTMQIIIQDDGDGFDIEEKELGDGNGLDNMRFRMEKIGGTCRFLPTKKGTIVELTFNLKGK